MIREVDLIITTKNRIKELLFTIEKMRSIGFQENQIFIVDDASSDDTFQTIRHRYPGIVIKKNLTQKGLIANRNFLMRSTSRNFVLSLDDDSNIRSSTDLEEALELLNGNKSFGIFTFRPFEQLQAPPARENLSDQILLVKTFIGCGHILKRELIHKLGDYREEFEFYCEELDYSLRAFKFGYKVVMKENLVVHHRIDWNLRNSQFDSDLSRGVYGGVWRSTLGFSNNLMVTLIYYPFPFDLFFIVRYIWRRTVKFLIIKKDIYGFFGGLKRFIKFIPYSLHNRDSLSIREFFIWIRLKSY